MSRPSLDKKEQGTCLCLVVSGVSAGSIEGWELNSSEGFLSIFLTGHNLTSIIPHCQDSQFCAQIQGEGTQTPPLAGGVNTLNEEPVESGVVLSIGRL